MVPGTPITYECGACGAAIEVDWPMRDAILTEGCVVCGADVTEDAFSPTISRGALLTVTPMATAPSSR